ncbi:MAG: hypothetical protein JRJ29_15665 [Deltaproteobacteria bacterium]|nr:hypothetical protein [Deltaproteobacteria bacterium]
MEKEKALTRREGELPAEVLPHFEQHSMVAQRVMEIALANTYPEDWASFGGKAWLTAPGAERVGRALGLTVKEWKWEKMDLKDDEGPHYYIVCTGKVGHEPTGLWVDAIGVAWSRKPFWYIDKGRKRHIGEINLGNIIKDAYSDMERNGITRLLGLRGLSWEVLKKYGISEAKAQKVEFKGQKPQKKQAPKKTAAEASEYASEEQRAMLARMACKKVIGSTQESILGTIPEKLPLPALNTLLKYVAEAPGELELEEWEAKIKEVM